MTTRLWEKIKEREDEACPIKNRFLKFLFASHKVGGTWVMSLFWLWNF